MKVINPDIILMYNEFGLKLDMLEMMKFCMMTMDKRYGENFLNNF